MNYPLIARQVQPHQGTLPATYSLVQVEPGNVVLTAVKKSEDDNALILRSYEWAGSEAQVRLRLARPVTSAVETNLMEEPQQPLAVGSDGLSVLVPTRPYEIKTVKIAFGK